jgi:hypothetical protein
MKPPAAVYTPSQRKYEGLPELDYPLHGKSVIVTTCGRICFQTRKINLSRVFAGQRVGIKQVDDRLWFVSFMGYVTWGTSMTQNAGWNHSTTLSGQNCYPCLRNKVLPMSQQGHQGVMRRLRKC